MRYTDNKIFLRYLREEDESEDDILMRGIEKYDLFRYEEMQIPQKVNVPEHLKTETYKVDITEIKPGQVKGASLINAFKIIRQTTPPLWQFNIQWEINLPVTIKLGGMRSLIDVPAYEFDFNDVKDDPSIISGAVLYNTSDMVKVLGLNIEKVYLLLTYLPPKTGDTQPRYSTFLTGKTNDSKPFIIGMKFTQKTPNYARVYGEKSSISLHKLTVPGILFDLVASYQKRRYGGDYKHPVRPDETLNYVKQFQTYDSLPPDLKNKVTDIFIQNATQIGLI